MKNKNYPLNNIPAYSSIKELFDGVFAEFCENLLFRIPLENGNEHNIKYKTFSDEINSIGTVLFGMDLRNCRIAILGENNYEWILTYFSVVNGGNVAVPLDKDLPLDDLIELIDGSECKALIYSFAYVDAVEAIKEASCVKTYICMDELKNFVEPGLKLIEGGYKEYINYCPKSEQLASIVYTSGTSGKSKGVMLSHLNIASDAVYVCRFIYGSGDCILALPLHHTFGLVANIIAPMLYGVSIYICRSLRNIQADMNKSESRFAIFVPLIVETIYKRIWKNAKKNGKDAKLRNALKISKLLMKFGIDVRKKLFSEIHELMGGNLEFIICGGAMLNYEIAADLYAMGIEIINGYGITECSPVVTVNRNKYNRVGSVGLPLGCCKIRIFEPDAEGIGEILVKGSNVMLGYFNAVQETREAFTEDGWFKTGDLGYIDKDGFLFITGRTKNLIILANGKNVSAEELEQKIMLIDAVSEVAVYESEGKILAEIYPDPAHSGDADDFIKKEIVSLNAEWPSYKRVAEIKIRDEEFPKTSTKKIIRYNNKTT